MKKKNKDSEDKQIETAADLDEAAEIKKLDKEIADKIKVDPKISPKEKANLLQRTIRITAGPLPDPEILAAYQKIYPKAAEKIIDNAMEESNHRRKLETDRQKRRGKLAWLILLIFFALIIAFLCFSYSLLVSDHEVWGSIFGVAGIGGCIGAFKLFFKSIDILSGSYNTNKKTQK
ncbi:DUF2335 domain-containing protein [Lactobacillus sp. ESL0791]|uniref:DUF2335 domain-containing protein n=1 Tax=Lactobacillus sp. ESL0791 TaxID=2983234 RepID=UPI0023F8C099|nr:DUF2335 domain-containing protein [Lactobacillus sp. ESL0791]MDF7639170.1 DUF2335 domain-containing protein [Lactobacillus sp. ESL0791]